MKRKKRIVSYTFDEIQAMIARGEDRTDWERIDRMTEEELERNIASDPDSDLPMEGSVWFKMEPLQRQRDIRIRLDADVLDWFKREGRGYQTRINSALRAYVRASRAAKHPRMKRRRAAALRVR